MWALTRGSLTDALTTLYNPRAHTSEPFKGGKGGYLRAHDFPQTLTWKEPRKLKKEGIALGLGFRAYPLKKISTTEGGEGGGGWGVGVGGRKQPQTLRVGGRGGGGGRG